MGHEPSIVMLGLSYRTAPVEVRERVAFSEVEVRERLGQLRGQGVCDEAFLLSTCNRVELYGVPAHGEASRIERWMAQHRGPRGESLEPYLYRHSGRDAIVHLFRVACALDSLVVGEPQILGQVRDAVKVAEESGALGRLLGPLSRRCLHVAKRVRTETAVGRGRVGIGNAGVDLARQIFGDLVGKRALLIGAGEMGREVAKALLSAGLAELLVANRTFERAVEVAEQFGGTPIGMDRVADYLSRVDVVIAASGATEPIIRPAEVRTAIRARRYRPLFLVDLAVPRNVDPAVGELDEAYLFNVDDLEQVVERGQHGRSQAAVEALRLVEQEADAFVVSLAEIDVGPKIGALVRAAEHMRELEIARSQRLLATLDDDGKKAVDAMTRALVKRLLDEPLRAVREAARAGDAARVAQILAVFGVNEDGGTGEGR
jgi:glutamyl-tRNA reductase